MKFYVFILEVQSQRHPQDVIYNILQRGIRFLLFSDFRDLFGIVSEDG